MAASKRKQDEKHLKMLREMVALPHNKQCFDCHQRGPTYVNMTIGSFVCTSCSGILRGLNPPHRVKSISMTTFSPEEMEFLKTRGNEYCRRVWLGLYASQALIEPESKDEQKIKDFMAQKYEKKRWYVQPNEAFKTPPQTQPTSTQLPNQNNRQTPETKPLQTLLGQNTPNLVVQNNQITRRLRTSFESPQQGRSLLSQPFPSPTSSISQHSPGQQPSNKPAGSLDLLAEFDTNPFGGPPQSQNNANASFANFDDQSAFSMPAQVPSRSNQATTNNQFTTFTVATPVSSPSTSASTTWASRTDRYAALADLDTLMSSNNSTGTTWDNSSTNWNATSSSVTGFGSTPTSNAPSIFSTVSSNPFTNTTSTWSQQGHIATANPFQIGNTSALGNGMAQGAGFGQFPANAQQTAFGHFGQSSSFGQFGTTTTPTNSTAGFGMNQFGAQNGGFPMSQSPTNWASGGWGMTQTTTSPFGMGNQAAFGGPINAFQPPLGKMDLTGQPGVGQYGNWSTQPSPQAAGNPFMAGNQIPPRSNTSNPFL